MKEKIKKTLRFFKNILRKIFVKICSRKIKRLYKQNKYDEILKLNGYYLDSLAKTSIEDFKKIKNSIEQINIERIANKDRIKIGFVLYTPSMWSCEKLYRLLLENEKYDPYIVVCKFETGAKESNEKNYESTCKYFKEKKYNMIMIDSKEINDIDIMFYLTPFDIIPKSICIQKLPLKFLTAYVTYSFMIADRDEKFNLPMYHLTWKFFADTLIYKQLMNKKTVTGDDNVEFCGYIRMDEFYDKSAIKEDKIWKLPSKNKKMYKIIYAPHHSVFDEKAGFSTFDQNYMFMYELAKKYKDNTTWIVKPHPLLGGRIIRNGFFKDYEEYDNYLKLWNELPNAKVVTDGTYFDIFKTSDTIILDSVSFLAEYQYVHKPLLFLTRETQRFNEFGDKLKEVLYKVPGDDLASIEAFLKDVVINNNDTMKKEREDFFDKYLNYYKYNNNQLSTESIYKILEDTFNKR